MVQKFVMYAPLYRQEQEWNRAGVQLSRQTMSNWVLRVAEDWLKPVYEELHRRLIQRQVLHADETTLQVLKLEGRAEQVLYVAVPNRWGCGTSHCVVRVPAYPEGGERGCLSGEFLRVAPCRWLLRLPPVA